jgi:HTH-type transcriptional regulator, sugar sensing transcriptional regulator
MKQKELESLESVGLTEKEALTYLDLLKYGESQTGKICDRTKIPSSHIYAILGSLVNQGLVNYKVVNNIKVFKASDPDVLTQLFEEKESKIRDEKEKLLKSIPKLKVLPFESEKLSDFKYFYGVRGIKSLYTEVINSWKENDEYCITSAPLASFKNLEAFFIHIVHKKRIKDKVSLKILVNSGGKKWGEVRKKMPFTKVRYLDINTKTEYGVLNDYFFLVTYGDEPYGLLIKDRNFASTYKVFFDILWDNADN